MIAVGPFPCPFCEGKFSASAEPPSVLHSIPVCAKFTELDPDKFLVAAREAREAKPS
jgi:hypothetical protein